MLPLDPKRKAVWPLCTIRSADQPWTLERMSKTLAWRDPAGKSVLNVSSGRHGKARPPDRDFPRLDRYSNKNVREDQ
jgi:hypothetical protein